MSNDRVPTVSAQFDTVIVGAGAVGLAIAASLTRRGREVMVLEQHPRIGAEVSQRSSEVIHAGLYYPPGSLKARLCVEGRKRLYAFAAENGVAVRKSGKLVVAADESETARLQDIAASARENGAGEVRLLSGAEAHSLEPHLKCVAALHSPETGVIDSAAYLQALEGHITGNGGTVVLNTRVTGLARGADEFEIEAGSGAGTTRLTARVLVLAGGLHATRLGSMLAYDDGYQVPETVYAKGHYFALAGRTPFSRLIYPVPSGGGLGVHLTIDTAGAAKFGPDIERVDAIEYGFEDKGGARACAFADRIRRYWPGLPEGALAPAYTGIRPKLGDPHAFADFAIHGPREHGIAGLISLYGIDSPGLTSSLAIGEHVAEMGP
jgi:L-2-hydroxyglutarate oxidase LhgO